MGSSQWWNGVLLALLSDADVEKADDYKKVASILAANLLTPSPAAVNFWLRACQE